MNTEPEWWGYLHVSGSVQLKRWWGDHRDYTTDCQGNPFVKKVVPPFIAKSRDEALATLKTKLEEADA